MKLSPSSLQPRVGLGILLLSVSLPHGASAQGEDPSINAYADKILNRAVSDPEVTDRNSDGQVDVRDLAIFINGRPISATFGTAETLAFHSQGSVTLPIHFSKPVTGTIKFDLGGNARVGVDYTLVQNEVTVTNAASAQITVNFITPWQGVGGEKVVRLTLNRDPLDIPSNGVFSSHILRIRQFDAGEFVGLLTFPSGSGLPTLPVRIGLSHGGTAYCSFENNGSFLGEGINLAWSNGSGGFPNFTGVIPLTIAGESLNRPGSNLNATLEIARLEEPYDGQIAAYLEGFPPDDQPAMYQSTFTFHDLITAGASRPQENNPYAVRQQGRLCLQPVHYATVP